MLSSRVRTGRSIKGYSLPPHCSRGERRAIEKLSVNGEGGRGLTGRGTWRGRVVCGRVWPSVVGGACLLSLEGVLGCCTWVRAWSGGGEGAWFSGAGRGHGLGVAVGCGSWVWQRAGWTWAWREPVGVVGFVWARPGVEMGVTGGGCGLRVGVVCEWAWFIGGHDNGRWAWQKGCCPGTRGR